MRRLLPVSNGEAGECGNPGAECRRTTNKELIWFNSGHGLSEADKSQFVDVMVNHVLKQTWPGR